MRDPSFEKGALGDQFAAGVYGRERFEHQHERDTADLLADRNGCSVHARKVIHGAGVKNPDAMVRWDRDDPGRTTEFKRLDRATYKSVRRQVWESADQVNFWGGGEVVIDGRKVSLSEHVAREHVNEAIAEANRKNKPVPRQIHVILGSGSMITIQGRA